MNMSGMTRPCWAGLKAAFGMPAMGLFCALASFGALTEAIGIELWVMIASVLLIWSMPALMAFNEMMVTMSGVWAMVIAIAFANVRNVPMVVTAIPMVRTRPGIRWGADLTLAQLMSPTTWVHILATSDQVPLEMRRRYFVAFSITVLTAALLGAVVGYFGVQSLPKALQPTLLLLTPLYLVLIMLSVRRLSSYLAFAAGAVAVPALMTWSMEWGLAIGGLGAGTVGFLLAGEHKKKAGK